MKRFLQLLIMIVSFIVLNSCKNDITFTVFKFDDSRTSATNITAWSVKLNYTIVEAEYGTLYLSNNMYIAIADYPEYFKGERKNNGWAEYQNMGNLRSGTFTADFKGLAANKTYYYAPYVPARNTDEITNDYVLRGEVKSFTTKEFSQKDLTLDDYLGTYEMSYYDEHSKSYKTTSNVKIALDSDGKVYVVGFPTSNGLHFWAYGVWDEANNNILLSNKYYHTTNNVWTNIFDTKFVDVFTPCYYDKNTETFKNTFTNDGYSYVCLSMLSYGNLTLTPPAKASTDGVYSNAFCWAWIYYPSWELYMYWYIITDVKMTKQ